MLLSSARYKRDIHNMGGASAGLMKLRPVSFRYKDDPSETLQYGLMAEEVERVYRSWRPAALMARSRVCATWN